MGNALWADLRARLGRLAAVGLATALGVAFVATAGLVLASAHRGVEAAVAAPYVNADLVVLSGGEGLDADAVAAVKDTPGVLASSAIASISTLARWSGSRGAHAIGINRLSDEPSLRWQHLAEGRFPTGPDQLMVATDQASALDLHVGTEVTVNGAAESQRELMVVGTYTGGLTSGSSGFAADEATMLELDPGGYAQEIVVRTDGSAASAAAVQDAVGDKGAVVPAEQHVDELVSGVTSDVDVLGMLLFGFSAIAIFVAALVIANTFAVVLAQRTRELALLRCIGTGRRQLLRSVLTEAAVLGVGAGAVGVGAGIGLAALMVTVLRRVQTTYALDGVAPTVGGLLTPLVIGVAVTVLAAVLPAIRATRVAPLAALRPTGALAVRSRPGALRMVASVGFLVIGGGALALGTVSSALSLGMLGGVVSFIGVLLAAPILVPAALRLLGLGARASGVPGRLAVFNAVRNPRRTAATCSALLVGVTLIAMMTVGAASLQRSEAAALDAQLPVDLVIDGGPDALPAGVADGVDAIDGVTAAVDLDGTMAEVAGTDTTVRVLGVDPVAARDVVRGSSVDGLEDGTALVQWGVADAVGVTDGDSMDLGHGVKLQVVIANSLETPAVYVTDADLARLDSDAPLALVWARVDDDASARDVTASAQDLIASSPDASVGGAFTLRADYENVFSVLLLLATGLLAVALLIALVGVGNTMSLSVVERTREHAVMRAIGLTRRQLAGTLAIESLLLAATAGVLGVGLGIVYGIAGAATLFGSITDYMLFAIPWGQLGLLVLVAALAGMLASVLPARRAARTPPAAALGD